MRSVFRSLSFVMLAILGIPELLSGENYSLPDKTISAGNTVSLVSVFTVDEISNTFYSKIAAEENVFAENRLPGSDQSALNIINSARKKKRTVAISCNDSIRYLQQNLIFLSDIKKNSTNKLVYKTLSAGSLSAADSVVTVPCYMNEYEFCGNGKTKIPIYEQNFASMPELKEVLFRLCGDFETDMNFYRNRIDVSGQKIPGPLSASSFKNFRFYLTDSLKNERGKAYNIIFIYNKTKNLTYTGNLVIDSATSAIVKNKILFRNNQRKIVVSQVYRPTSDKTWILDEENLSIEMLFKLSTDSISPHAKIKINRTTREKDSGYKNEDSGRFSQTNFKADTLNSYLNKFNHAPLMKFGRLVSSAVLTGYVPVGIFNIGKIQQLARITDIEGLRLTLPVQTNGNLWQNVSLGGYLGYGMSNREFKYSGFAQFRISENKRRILSVGYTDDYRRVDYNYNDFIVRENPLATGDIDIGGTIFAFHSQGYLNRREEVELSFENEWNNDIESKLFIRNHTIYSCPEMPFTGNGFSYDKMMQHSVTLATRFSFDEHVYDNHLQRIYVPNNNPAVYAIFEGGDYNFFNKNGHYAKISTILRQNFDFGFGHWNYIVEGGCILGDVPYPLLEIPYGRETNGYNRFQFSLLNYMEYAADKYVLMHNEFIFNSLLTGKLPIIKHLNLKELVTLKTFYGTLSDRHSNILDMPPSVRPMKLPYTEIGIGFNNILNLFTLQSVWRLTDLDHKGATSWGIKASLRISL
ncbi:MAG: DUF5686 family protein [Paludibacter sp.]|nr:DUF5686 family protein [Paludibacter sp.]